MDDDQQFCLRWNNHQSTLVAVFDTLLEKGTLVDCTLAAEGKYLNAHKVVLSACSPYFESLLSKHFDKHPILILKDVKFQELKAMMDYMYRGEVNISQDQLGALLKAAESLQIKGLSDNRKGETERKPAPVPPPPKSPQPTSALSKVQGLTIEQRSRDDSREGSMSPGPRKKKRLRRKSEELDNHDASNSSESHSLPAQNIPSSLPAVSKMNADVPEPVESKSEILTRHKQPEDIPQVPIIKEKLEHTELMLEPKSEYVDEMNEDSIEDLTLDDDDISNMEQMDDQAGPSHGNAGEGSSQGFGGWHMGNQSQDEVFLAAQEAVGAHRDSQGNRFPVISMRDFLKVRNEANSKRRKKSKDEPRKNASDGQKIILRRKTRKTPRSAAKSAPIHATYHSKDGIVIKTLRCVKCGGFVSAGKPECNRCIALQKSEQGKTHSSKGDKLKTVSKVSPSCRISMKTMKKQAPIRKKSTQQKKIIAIPKKMNPKLSNDPKILATKTSRKSVDNSKSPKKKVNGIMAPKKKTRINPNGKTYKENFQATKSKDLSKHSLNLSEKKNLADHNVDNIPKRKIQFNTLSTDISTSGDHRPTKESFLRYLDLGQTCSHVEYDTETHVGLADLLLDSNMISEECMSLLDSPNIEIIQEKDKDC